MTNTMIGLFWILMMVNSDSVCTETLHQTSPGLATVKVQTATSLPFELIDNRIFVDVKLNGQGPFRFIFDSGAGAIVRTEVANALGLTIERTTEGGGAGERRVAAGIAKVSETELGGIPLNDLEFEVISFADARHVFGTVPLAGIIGNEVFERFVVRIDYQRNLLTLIEPSRFVYRGKGVVVPFRRQLIIPLVDGEVDRIPGRFGIDTGARSSLILYGPFVEKNNLRARYAPKLEGITGWGIGGPIRSQVARVRTLRLGAVELRSVVARLSLQRSGALTASDMAGIVGPDVLKQFDITFDYSRQRIIFEKNNNYGQPDTYDRAGMWLGQAGKHFQVLDVVAGGPAAKAGLKVGDEILAIDGRSTGQLVLPTVRLQFKSYPPKKRVRLLIQSGTGQREVIITLRELV